MEKQSTYWFVFISNALLLQHDGSGYHVPCSPEPPFPMKEWTPRQELPAIDGTPCMAYSLNTPPADMMGLVTMGLRESWNVLPRRFYNAAGKASELLYWDSNTKYCGVCGAPMRRTTIISKQCTHCGKEIWPQVSPAIIVRIRRGDQILLVHAKNFRRSEMYGLVAGFVETGETLEECVVREVQEEVGLVIENIRYFGSQPWPYPCGIMIGFTADYVSGEVHVQEEELSNAGWFDREHLPPIPDKMSIARKLIDDYIAERETNS
ncbi:MAG: NAD(+) diphosphatase [Bacteroidaceae bacterium]|nr:NAD(+) diphosphatase [Bacteroidaceae bacterium]